MSQNLYIIEKDKSQTFFGVFYRCETFNDNYFKCNNYRNPGKNIKFCKMFMNFRDKIWYLKNISVMFLDVQKKNVIFLGFSKSLCKIIKYIFKLVSSN